MIRYALSPIYGLRDMRVIRFLGHEPPLADDLSWRKSPRRQRIEPETRVRIEAHLNQGQRVEAKSRGPPSAERK